MSISDTSIDSLGFAEFLGTLRGGDQTMGVGEARRALQTALKTSAQGQIRDIKQAAHQQSQDIVYKLSHNRTKMILIGFFSFCLLGALIATGVFYKKVRDGCKTDTEEELDKNYKGAYISLIVSSAIFVIIVIITFLMKDQHLNATVV